MNANQIFKVGGGVVRGTALTAGRLGWRIVGQAFGLVRRPLRSGAKPDMDDVTLARKIESEIFRSSRAPKANVDINVVDGVVWLRGEVKTPQQIRTLEAKARAVPEVRDVENLLHLPKTPAATRADTPRRQQRTRSSTKRPTPRQSSGGRVSDDRTDAIVSEAEPSPAEQARKGEGRSPAPLGSQGAEQPSEDQNAQSSPSGNGGETPGGNGEAAASGNGGGGTESIGEGVGFVPHSTRPEND